MSKCGFSCKSDMDDMKRTPKSSAINKHLGPVSVGEGCAIPCLNFKPCYFAILRSLHVIVAVLCTTMPQVFTESSYCLSSFHFTDVTVSMKATLNRGGGGELNKA